MRLAKQATDTGGVETARAMLEIAQQTVAQRLVELENLEAEVETLPAGPQRQAAQADRDAAKTQLARARGEVERREAVVHGAQRRLEEARATVVAQQRAASVKEEQRRRRVWSEHRQEAGLHYEALLNLVDEILPPKGYEVPSNVRQSLKALSWDVARFLKGAG